MTSTASRRGLATALALTAIGAFVVPAAIAASSASAATPTTGRVGPYRFASATGACTSTGGKVTGIAVPKAAASMYPKWFGAPGPNHTRVAGQYVRTQSALLGLRNGVWKTLGAPHKGTAVLVERAAKGLPAAPAFAGTSLPAGYDAYRVVQQVLWYSPLKPDSVDGTATRTVAAYTNRTATLSACLPAPAPLSAVTATASPTSFTVSFTRPGTPYFKAAIVRWAPGATAPGDTAAGAAAVVTGSSARATGLRPVTAYSYSAWAIDTAGQLSAAVTGTVTTTRQPPVTAKGVTKAASVSANADETCVVSSAGAVSCWGAGNRGQLGNGAAKSSATAVAATTTGVSSVSVGGAFACALTTAGKVLCWGADDHGQLGDGGTTDRSRPQAVAGLADVTQISAGASHACAVVKGTLGTSVYCWGANDHGQLGDGTTTERRIPVPVSGGLNLFESFTSVSAGATHSCATTSTRGVLCWGDNSAGELGNGSTTSSSTPVRVNGEMTGAVSAGAGHTCALPGDGTVRCWGGNTAGELGDGTTTSRPTPDFVKGVTTAAQLSSTGTHTCAVLSGGGVTCWGRNTVGQLGDGTWEPTTSPVDVASVSGAEAAATGTTHSCAVLSDGTVRCWGSDAVGQLGNG